MRITPLLAALMLAGCAGLEPVERDLSLEHVNESNYQVGQSRQAFVGEPIVRVRDYWLETLDEPAVEATVQTSIKMNFRRPRVVAAGEVIPIVGKIEYQGKLYRIARFDGLDAFGDMLLTDDGRLTGKFRGMLGAVQPMDSHKIEPADALFKDVTKKTVVETREFTNFELIYSGISGGSINILYREYTPDNLIRPAFSQNVTYDTDSGAVRFRDVLIQIHEADAASIRYTVLEDGL